MTDILIPNGGKTKLLTPQVRISLPTAIPNGGVVKVLRDNVVVGTATQLTPISFVYSDTITPDKHYLYTARLEVGGVPNDSVNYKISAIGTDPVLTVIYYTDVTAISRNGVSNTDTSSHTRPATDGSGQTWPYDVAYEPTNEVYAGSSTSFVRHFYTQAYVDSLKCNYISDQTVNGIPVFIKRFRPAGMNLPYITASTLIMAASPTVVYGKDGSEITTTHAVAGARLNYHSILGLDLSVIFGNLTAYGLTLADVSRDVQGVSTINCSLYLTRTPSGWKFIINEGDMQSIPFSPTQQLAEPNSNKLSAVFDVVAYPSMVRKETVLTIGGNTNESIEMRNIPGVFGAWSGTNNNADWHASFTLSDLALSDFVGSKTVREGTTFHTPAVSEASALFNLTTAATQLVINTPFVLTGTVSGLLPNVDCELSVFHQKKAPPQGNNQPWPVTAREFIGFKTNGSGVGTVEVKVTETDTTVIRSEYYTKVRYAGGGSQEIAHSAALELEVDDGVPELVFDPTSSWQLRDGGPVTIRPEQTMQVGGTASGMLAFTDYLVKYYVRKTVNTTEPMISSVTKTSSSTGTFSFQDTLTIPAGVEIGSNVSYAEIWNAAGTIRHFTTTAIALTVIPPAVYGFTWTTQTATAAPGASVEFTATISGLDPNKGYYLRPRYNGDTISPTGENNALHTTDGLGAMTVSLNAKIPLGAADNAVIPITCWIQSTSQEVLYESTATNVTVDIPAVAYSFNWVLNNDHPAPDSNITGTATLNNGAINTTFVYSVVIKNASNVTIATFPEVFISTNSSGNGTDTFSLHLPSDAALGQITLNATGTKYGEVPVLFTAPELTATVSPSADLYTGSGQNTTNEMQGNVYEVAGVARYLPASTNFRLLYTFIGSDAIERTLADVQRATGGSDVLDLTENLTIPMDAAVGTGHLYVSISVASGGPVLVRSPALLATIQVYTPPPVITWALGNGQATTVNENGAVNLVGNITNLLPNTQYSVNFRRELNGARDEFYTNLTTNSSGVLDISRSTTMVRTGFQYGIYQGGVMKYNVLVSGDPDINITTAQLNVIIGVMLPDPAIDWSTTGNLAVNRNSALTATGLVTHLSANTEYSIYVRGRDHNYNDFDLLNADQFTDANGALTINFASTVPGTTEYGWFELTAIVRTLGTYTEVLPPAILYYEVSAATLASATWEMQPSGQATLATGEMIKYQGVVSGVVEDSDYLVTVFGRDSTNAVYELTSNIYTGDANGQIIMDDQAAVDSNMARGTLKVFMTVRLNGTLVVQTPNLIFTLV